MKKWILLSLGFFLFSLSFASTQETQPLEVKAKLTDNQGSFDFSLSCWNADTQIWEKSWLDLPQTELDPVSPHVISNGAVLITISGKLHSIDLATGTINFRKAKVGACSHQPVVGKDGTIYCSGYYGPVITAVAPDGNVKWNYANDDMWWPDAIQLHDDVIQVLHYHSNGEDEMVSTFSESGKLLKTEKRK